MRPATFATPEPTPVQLAARFDAHRAIGVTIYPSRPDQALRYAEIAATGPELVAWRNRERVRVLRTIGEAA